MQARETDSLLDRAYLFLEDEDRTRALEYFEKVLDGDPRSTFAYLGRLVIALHMEDMFDLPNFETSYTEHPDFVKAVRFADDDLAVRLSSVAAARDAAEDTYKRALSLEANATSEEQLAEAYKLYREVDTFADAEDRATVIYDAISVARFYAQMGTAKIHHLIDASHAFKADIEQKIEALTLLVNMAKPMLEELKKSISRKTAERDSLGIFKGKRKKELTAEIEAETAKIAEVEKDLKKNRTALRYAQTELEKCESVLALESLVADFSPMSDEGLATFLSGDDDDFELEVYTEDKIPLGLIKNPAVLTLVSKNPIALYAMLNSKPALKVITATKKSAAAVGASPVFAAVATMCMDVVGSNDALIAHLPVAHRIATELKNGKKTISFGRFPKDGKDPYADIILPPGTPYPEVGDPVEWLVLEVDTKTVTLICNKSLCRKSYEPTSHEGITWENCELRGYMQGEMLSLLFNSEERKLLVPMECVMKNGTESVRCVDTIRLPTFEEIKNVLSSLPNDGFAWTCDSIESSVYERSLLVSPSVASLKYKGEKYSKLVSYECYIAPVITITLS